MAEPPVEIYAAGPAFLSAELLRRLRATYQEGGAPSLTGPKALSLVAHALTVGGDHSLGMAICEALMQGFDAQQLVDQVTPALVGYVGVEVAPRFHRTLAKVMAILAASATASPVEIGNAISRALAPQRFHPERARAALTDSDLATVRAGYDDEVFTAQAGRIIRGSSTNMDGFVAFLDSPIYDPARLDPKLREAMILTVMASRADVFGMAVHFYAAIGVGLMPEDLRDILGSIEDASHAALATSVLEGILVLLSSAIDRRTSAMSEIISEIIRRFAATR